MPTEKPAPLTPDHLLRWQEDIGWQCVRCGGGFGHARNASHEFPCTVYNAGMPLDSPIREIDALRAEIEKLKAGRTETATGEPPREQCLVCGYIKTLAVWWGGTNHGVCLSCRDIARGELIHPNVSARIESGEYCREIGHLSHDTAPEPDALLALGVMAIAADEATTALDAAEARAERLQATLQKIVQYAKKYRHLEEWTAFTEEIERLAREGE